MARVLTVMNLTHQLLPHMCIVRHHLQTSHVNLLSEHILHAVFKPMPSHVPYDIREHLWCRCTETFLPGYFG